MLKKLDRYILGKYASSFLFSALIFSLVAVAVDLSEKIEKFILNKLSIMEVLSQYYRIEEMSAHVNEVLPDRGHRNYNRKNKFPSEIGAQGRKWHTRRFVYRISSNN